MLRLRPSNRIYLISLFKKKFLFKNERICYSNDAQRVLIPHLNVMANMFKGCFNNILFFFNTISCSKCYGNIVKQITPNTHPIKKIPEIPRTQCLPQSIVLLCLGLSTV